jgi:flagellar basal-body rod protein FlgG
MAEDVEPEEIPFNGEVLQGYLEGSNVNAIREMVDMITLLREFEAGQKAIRVQDEMLEKSSNEIGRV